jgi:hypothetical protein
MQEDGSQEAVIDFILGKHLDAGSNDSAAFLERLACLQSWGSDSRVSVRSRCPALPWRCPPVLTRPWCASKHLWSELWALAPCRASLPAPARVALYCDGQ